MYRNLTIKTYEDNTLLYREHTIGLIEDNILTYNTDNDNIRINLKEFSFRKENLETILKLTQEKCTLTLKEMRQNLDIPISYINYQNENNNIEIIYQLISQDNPLKIIIEIGSENNEI